jgi:hypothetical protein
MKKETLTQKELVSILKNNGCPDVTERRITDWRENFLLPKFDVIGQGLGKCKGKSPSLWKNRRMVVIQALWIYELRKYFKKFDDIYLPLWTLGFPIPLKIVRKKLTEPLEVFIEGIKAESIERVSDEKLFEREAGFIEDYISDMVAKACSKDKFTETFFMPQNVNEAMMNIFVNPKYNLIDFEVEFEDALFAVQEHKKKLEETFQTIFDAENKPAELQKTVDNESTIELVLNNAEFIQQTFSSHQFLKAVKSASDEELRQVQIDMAILCRITRGINQGIQILMKDILKDIEEDQTKRFMQILFSSSKFIIWSDLSLRKNGYGELINQTRFTTLKKFEEEFNNEETKKKLAEESPKFAKAFEKMMSAIKKYFENLPDESGLFLNA